MSVCHVSWYFAASDFSPDVHLPRDYRNDTSEAGGKTCLRGVKRSNSFLKQTLQLEGPTIMLWIWMTYKSRISFWVCPIKSEGTEGACLPFRSFSPPDVTSM